MTTKEKVLNILTQQKGEAVSGQKLAQECQVSRAAIWKAVNAIRNEGFCIQGAQNSGYSLFLEKSQDLFSPELFTQTFTAAFPDLKNCHIECFKELDSTNTYAKKLLSSCGNLRDQEGQLTESGKKYHKSIYLAESQTQGRGRLGRSFVSPGKSGIYLSVILAPQGGITQPAIITVYAAVAVCRAIKKLYKIEASIKWINDIFVENKGCLKKAAGILTEGSANFESGLIESAVIGVGINISPSPELQASEAADIAGYVGLNSSEKVSRCRFAAEVAGQLIKIYEEEKDSVISEYKSLLFIIGKKLTIHPVIGDESKSYEAIALGIDSDASLLVQLADKTTKKLSSGEVSIHSDSLLSDSERLRMERARARL